MSAYPEHVENHDGDADGDRGIGDVEGPEMIGPPVHVDEIDHRPGHDPIQEIARKLGRPPSQIALRWIIQQGVVALPMTTKRENCLSNLRALDFELSEEDMSAITALTRQNRRLISPAGWAPKWDN